MRGDFLEPPSIGGDYADVTAAGWVRRRGRLCNRDGWTHREL